MPNERLNEMVAKLDELNDELDPEIIKIRDKIISKIGNKPLDEVNEIIKKLLNDQMDENTRLGVLAARLKIIRQKIEMLYENKPRINVTPRVNSENIDKVEEPNKNKVTKQKEEWIRVKLLEACDIEGKSIDKDVILDVKKSDGEKLIKSKKAEEVKNSETNNEDVKKDEKKEPEQKQKEIKSNSKKEEEKEKKTDKVEIKGTEDTKKDELEKKDTESISSNQDNVEKEKSSLPNQSTEGVEVNNDVKSEQNKDTKQKDETKTGVMESPEAFQDTKGKKDLLKQHEEKATQTDSEEK